MVFVVKLLFVVCLCECLRRHCRKRGPAHHRRVGNVSPCAPASVLGQRERFGRGAYGFPVASVSSCGGVTSPPLPPPVRSSP